MILQRINHSRFKHETVLNCMPCVKVMNVVNSLHDPNFATAPSMSWPDSNQLQPLCLPSVLKPAPGNFCVTLLGHVTAISNTSNLVLCNWDVLLAISCAWAPCTPISLPCSRRWVNTLLIRNAEAKAWTARASASEPLVAGTLIMKESRMPTGPFWFARFEHFNNAHSLQSRIPWN